MTVTHIGRFPLPPGLTLEIDGQLHGTSTAPGTYAFAVYAKNAYGDDLALVHVVIPDPERLGEPSPETNLQRMSAKICTKGAKHRRECATRTLFGPFPELKGRAAVRLVRGPVTHATGRVTAGDRMTLQRRCEPPLEDPTGLMESEPRCEVPFGRYTLVLRRNHVSTFVPVTLH